MQGIECSLQHCNEDCFEALCNSTFTILKQISSAQWTEEETIFYSVLNL